MLTAELKKRVVEKLLATENNYLLEEINRLLELEHYDETVCILSDSEKAKVNKSLQQIENGEYITDEDLNKETDKWLNG
jgi:hypothetical protein